MESVIDILLVEDDPDMCKAFEFCIHKDKKFRMAAKTAKQQEGLEILLKEKIGAVILDLELTEGDGINFLKELKSMALEKPLIIVITNNRSEITLSCVRSMGADFICQKNNESYSPERVLSIIEQTYPYRIKKVSSQMQVISFQRSQEENYQRARIEEVLISIGFKMNLKATAYLVDAIHYAAFEIKGQNFEMKEVYAQVGRKYHTDSSNVEKAIRDNIERTWSRSLSENIEKYYPYPISKDRGMPTNMEFVKNISRKMWEG